MQKLNYYITTTAPITFAEKSGDNVLFATKRYIPGSAIRGALAMTYIKKHNLQDAHLDETFNQIFLSGKVRFLPAYPKCTNKNQETSVIPFSFMVSKDGRSIKDFAWNNTPIPGYKKISGFAAIERATQTIHPTSANVQIEFHMSRCNENENPSDNNKNSKLYNERLTGSSKDGKVFNYEYLEPHQQFIGSIILDDDSTELLNTIKQLMNANLHLGRSKTAQYGTCQCTVISETTAPANNIDLNAPIYLYAHTAYIPIQDWQRIDTIAQEITSELNTALKEQGINTTINIQSDKTYAVTETIDGYVSVWNMKRERKTAISAGTLIGIDIPNITNDNLNILQNILYQGLGDRTIEGFGQFRLWNPLSSITKEQSKKQALNIKNIHPTVQNKARAILQKRILQELRQQAKQDADRLCKKQKTAVGNARGTLKRIEALMNSTDTKKEIQTKIKNFGKTAKDNLRTLCINNMHLGEYLQTGSPQDMPYAKINWGNKLEINIEKIQKDLGKDILTVSDDILFREYWFWLARFINKNSNKGGEQ